MEVVEEPPLNNPPVDSLKISVTCDESDENAVASVETDVCHKSNGVAESSESSKAAISELKSVAIENNQIEAKTIQNDTDVAIKVTQSDTVEPAEPSTSEPDTTSGPAVDNNSVVESTLDIEESSADIEASPSDDNNEISKAVSAEDVKLEDTVVEVESVVESTIDHVTFQTEILVESNDSETIETVCEDTKIDEQDTNNILCELRENIVLSEALRSSDVTDNVENNNCTGRQEVFNKEELLDILEGNDEEQTGNSTPSGYQSMHSDKILETQLALQQLSRLKKKPKKSRSIERLPRRKSEKKLFKQTFTKTGSLEVKNEENIVNDLVKEWDDEESTEVEKSNKVLEESENLSKSSIENVELHDSVNKHDESSIRTSIDSQPADGKTSTVSKSGDEGQPQRRLGRVIKKKVIFDPDNPDTFTKSKVIIKSKEQIQEKDQTPSKKVKTEQMFQRAKSKSPLSKMQWKKPSPKNIKQNKRLTEVDKLLMDEGAVNMIYQLTPEAPKGKKNMKTKAEFIKKIQSSSTPDTKEMKFRERKKESKYEEGEARRILGGKHRPSLNSSVKSPSVSEDFEAHSADDSIIYRRHSSSSYSSSCMSPRRLSDVEMSSQTTTRNLQQVVDHKTKSSNEITNERPSVDMFMSDSVELVRTETINKDDCLSIKEKLNSKLNLALKKRKRENSKADKPLKQKKVMKTEKSSSNSGDFKYLSIRYDAKLAVICVQKPGSISNVEVINELETVLKIIESNKDISVTLFMPECGATLTDLDLRPLLDGNIENRTISAYAMAEAIRSLLHTVEQHSKLLCVGTSGRCTGIGLALVGLSDVALASERSSFAIAAKSHGVGPIEPGVSVLTAYRNLPQSTLTDLVVFGRRLSASEALQSGLVSRTLWPDKFNEQVITVAKDIAAQPAQNIWLKKQMLNMKKSGSQSTFQNRLAKERDLFVEYWRSAEGQELLRTTYHAA